MKFWVLEHQSLFRNGYWTGDSLKFTTTVENAVWFVRRVDAERALLGWVLVDATPVEIEVRLSDGDEPRAQSESRDDAAAVNTNQGT